MWDVSKAADLFRFRLFRAPAGSQRRLPPSDEGGAPKGRRERKSRSFCRKNFGFSRLSGLARWPRSPAKSSKVRPISPSAAPPQLPRQEELRPGRAAERAGADADRAPLLPERAWPVPYNGPAERFWCGRYGQAGTGGTHLCVPQPAHLRRNPVRFAGCRCRAGHGPAPTMAQCIHSGAVDMGGPVPAEHINVFPTGMMPPSACIRQTGPVCTRKSGDVPMDAPHPVGAAAMPGPCRICKSGYAPTGVRAV